MSGWGRVAQPVGEKYDPLLLLCTLTSGPNNDHVGALADLSRFRSLLIYPRFGDATHGAFPDDSTFGYLFAQWDPSPGFVTPSAFLPKLVRAYNVRNIRADPTVDPNFPGGPLLRIPVIAPSASLSIGTFAGGIPYVAKVYGSEIPCTGDGDADWFDTKEPYPFHLLTADSFSSAAPAVFNTLGYGGKARLAGFNVDCLIGAGGNVAITPKVVARFFTWVYTGAGESLVCFNTQTLTGAAVTPAVGDHVPIGSAQIPMPAGPFYVALTYSGFANIGAGSPFNCQATLT